MRKILWGGQNRWTKFCLLIYAVGKTMRIAQNMPKCAFASWPQQKFPLTKIYPMKKTMIQSDKSLVFLRGIMPYQCTSWMGVSLFISLCISYHYHQLNEVGETTFRSSSQNKYPKGHRHACQDFVQIRKINLTFNDMSLLDNHHLDITSKRSQKSELVAR